MKSKILIILTVVLLCLGILPVAYCQNNKSADKAETGVAFEQALKNYEAYKQKEQEKLAKRLNSNLNQITEDWITQAKAEKEDLLGTRLEQSWEKLALSFAISPAHYEYYLRGYQYSIAKSDISKTESISAPYKAAVTIREDLYVVKNHSSDNSDANPYFYTVRTTYNLNFEYRQDKFVLINTDSKIVNIENNAPVEIKKFH